jgi:hypothetical protein
MRGRAVKIVEVWAKGYADESGLSRITILDDADPAAEARRAFGSFASVASVRPVNPPKAEPISEAYARLMSRNDNT